MIKDHPRTHGEKHNNYIRNRTDEGSPPYTRGKDFGRITAVKRLRITPVHTGKSSDSQEHICYC